MTTITRANEEVAECVVVRDTIAYTGGKPNLIAEQIQSKEWKKKLIEKIEEIEELDPMVTKADITKIKLNRRAKGKYTEVRFPKPTRRAGLGLPYKRCSLGKPSGPVKRPRN